MLLPFIIYIGLGLPGTFTSPEDFATLAKDLRGASDWKELVKAAEQEIVNSDDDSLALAYLAVAQTGLQDFEKATNTLQLLAATGVDLQANMADIGSPMVEVVNATYLHCWANFDPAFNRSCWTPLFEAFPDSPFSSVAASRLLMAALKLKEAEPTKRFESFFDGRMAAAKDAGDTATEADLKRRYVDGYLRAGISNGRVVELASSGWTESWSAAKTKHSFDGPTTGGDLTEAAYRARRECELDTDKAFNSISLATQLAGLQVEAGHPLFDMEAEPSVTFSDVTDAIGLGGIKATRVAAADFDNDGDPDLCFGGRLFENKKGKFVEVGKERGITRTGSGAAFGDFDGDGNLDLLIASSPSPFLYRNLGKKGKYAFEDVSATCGFAKVKVEAGVEGFAWVDFDDDGDLDVYLAVYEGGGDGHPDALLENVGDGKFIEVSKAKGIHDIEPKCGRGVSPVDIDGDGDTEIFVSNYRLQENLFWQWDGERLIDGSAQAGIKGVREPEDSAYFGHTIGSCWGDIDGDGDLDLFSANLAHPRFVRQGFSNMSLLGINQGDGTFVDEGMRRGLRFQETHSDPALIDIDNDGDLDLSITCVYEGVSSALYQNDGQGNFTPITFRSGASMFHGWGQSWLDIDGDGFLDVVFGSDNGVKVLLNSGNDNNSLRVKLLSKGRDSSAFNAIVTVTTLGKGPQQAWVRQLLNTRGTGSQDEPTLHFGLGTHSGKVKVEVRWPDTDRTESKSRMPGRPFTFKQARKAK